MALVWAAGDLCVGDLAYSFAGNALANVTVRH